MPVELLTADTLGFLHSFKQPEAAIAVLRNYMPPLYRNIDRQLGRG